MQKLWRFNATARREIESEFKSEENMFLIADASYARLEKFILDLEQKVKHLDLG